MGDTREDGGGGPRTAAGRPLRIALVAPPLLPIPPKAYAGTERIVAALADGLSRAGHQVTLFASGDSDIDGEVVPVLPRSVWSQAYRADAGLLCALAAATVRPQMGRFDVVHAHLDAFGLALHRSAPVPVVTTFHGRLDQEGVFEMIEAFADAPMIAISESQRRWHPGANWVATIPHGLALERMPFGPRPGPYLVLVGRASAEKGVAEAIEVARRAELPLRIALKAHDPYELDFVERVVRPVLSDRITFLGEVGPGERDPMLAGAYATLMLGGWPEPFGLVAIESLATGTPVIGRRAGALPEIIEHGVDGFLVDDLEEAGLAVRLVQRLDRGRIRDRALARFGTQRMVAEYVSAYRQLIADFAVEADRASGSRGSRARSLDGHVRASAVPVGALPIAVAGGREGSTR